MDISKLMLHPAAAKFTAAIPSNADCLALGETYARLIAHGDYESHCHALAIEYYLRTAAQVAFNNDSVLRGLSLMENARKARIRAHNAILRKG